MPWPALGRLRKALDRPWCASSGKGPAALVLAPTRELAQQIAAVFEEAGAKVGVRTLCVYGGVAKGPQAAALRKGIEVVVATPGRLEDLLQDGACRCARMRTCSLHAQLACLQADMLWWHAQRGGLQ